MTIAFAKFIKILGRGKQGARTLSEQEAEQAMTMMLAREASKEQEGAFWMLIRIREETVAETVGFTRAVRRHLASHIDIKEQVDIDWPAYAGKRNELPWFLLAALALADAGYRVVMHGHSFAQEERLYVDRFVTALRLPEAMVNRGLSLSEQLCRHNFIYVPLAGVSQRLAQMMDLKYELGLRSPMNTVVRMMNPFAAKHSIHGVFHKGYDELHAQACLALEDRSVLVFRGGNGEAEVNPEREVTLARVSDGELTWQTWPKAESNHVRNKHDLSPERMIAHWQGEIIDPFGEKAVLHTLASVLGLVYNEPDQHKCLALAHSIWSQRDQSYFNYLKVA